MNNDMNQNEFNNQQPVQQPNPVTQQFQQPVQQPNPVTQQFQQPVQQQNLNTVVASSKKINVLAIISVVCGVTSFFIFWWLSSIGIGLGIRSLKEIQTKNEKGKPLAIIGIILGAIALILYFVFNIIAIAYI